MANWDTMIKPYPGLLGTARAAAGYSVSPKDLQNATRYYTTQDYLDLQVWFNLTWFDPLFKQNDPLLKGLIEKGSGFTENEKVLLVQKQREVMALIIAEYRKLADLGRIELTTTPFYHPDPAAAVRYRPGQGGDARYPSAGQPLCPSRGRPGPDRPGHGVP